LLDETDRNPLAIWDAECHGIIYNGHEREFLPYSARKLALTVSIATDHRLSDIIENIDIANAVKDPFDDFEWRECWFGRNGDCSQSGEYGYEE
jgi:hypothetical protein